jgi:transposase, IS30 family
MLHIQFTRDARIELAVLLNAGKNQSRCAEILGMHKSSISTEIRRNRDPDGIYRGGHAHKRMLARRKQAKKPYRRMSDGCVRTYVIQKLKRYWSPEQIAGRLRRDRNIIICHETIYRFVYEEQPNLIKYLRHQKSKYRRKRGTHARKALNISLKIRRIGERPPIVEERSRIGDWENDTVIGKEKTQRILTSVERMSGFGIGQKLDVVTADRIHDIEVKQFKRIPKKKRHTLTRDNGIEFGDYDRTLEHKTGMSVYRARAYCSWDRGCNENWNGLLRQFFPKGMYFATITQYDIDRAVKLINNRPRKRLGYRTPREVFKSCDSG